MSGVGAAIELLSVENYITPEDYASANDVDYFTINRDSPDLNAWSRSNRWFHIDVINATATYNNDPTIATVYATQDNKAKRPIIEFYPNFKLFNNGVTGQQPVDFFDDRTTDAFTYVAGQENYWPDVEVYTAYTAQITGTTGTSTTITVDADDITGA